VIPREAGTLCAFGMTVTDVRHDYLRALHCTSDSVQAAQLDELYTGLEQRGRERLREDGFAPEEIVIERSVDARYPGQVYELTVAIPASEHYGPEHMTAIEQAFHAEHERQFGYRRDGLPVEFLHWRAAAVGRMAFESVAGDAPPPSAADAPTPIGTRRVYVTSAGEMADVPVHKVESLSLGARVLGPAVIAGDTTTILLDTGDVLSCDEQDSFLIEIAHRPNRTPAVLATDAHDHKEISL
jgi:N-methylhydantoinase A